jgi:hypothetical protein
VDALENDEWTIERWRVEPRWRTLADADDPQLADVAPPLWKDLTVATIAAVLLWGAAVVLAG